ncbi:MAG: hypothetical protein ACFCU5_00830 [Pleurocapsa sp.]
MIAQKFALSLRYALIAGFFPLVALVLGADSIWFAERDFSGQLLADGLAAVYFILLLWGLDGEERLMVLIFVPFSAIAEYIFSSVLAVYTYRLSVVPIYVPLGHAILFSTGLMLSKLPVAIARQNRLQPILLSVQGILFAGTILFLQDIFSAVLGTLFALVLWWRGCRLIYPIMGFLVLYIELLGTRLGCWVWQENAFNLFHTTNPPFGAFVFYVFGDIAILKISSYFHREVSV